MDIKKILVLCTGNSCRSQMMEGYFRQLLGGKALVYSAGIETHGVNPRAIEIMAQDGVDISAHTSTLLDEYLVIHFDFVITVCDHARESCPVFPSAGISFHYNFPDPARVVGTEEAVMDEFRIVRDLIKNYTESFVIKWFS